MVFTWQQTNFNAQTVAAYPGFIDGDFAVAARIADAFAPHEQTTPNMAVELDPGFIFDPRNASLSTVAAQSTGAITAPVSQPRIDRVVIDAGTGAVSVVTGTESASPSPPAIPVGKMPVARVLLQTSSTTITNAMITDERAVWGPPVPGVPWAVAAGSADAITASYAPANAALYDGLLLSFRASAANATTTPSFAPDGLTAYTITKKGGQALVAGDIAGNLAECIIRYNAANTRWELLNPQSSYIPPSIPNNDVLANISGSTAIPVGTTLSALIDSAIGSTRGALLERGSSGWALLPPGTSGFALLSNGSGADPSYGQVAKPGDNITEFTNNAGYVTGTVARPGDNITEFVNNAGYVTSASITTGYGSLYSYTLDHLSNFATTLPKRLGHTGTLSGRSGTWELMGPADICYCACGFCNYLGLFQRIA